MLEGMEDLRCVLRDSDSQTGDPTHATRWIAAPIESPDRVNACLYALLALPPISMPPDMAASYHGHSAKRFILNVVEASPLFTKEEEGEVGRFSGSTGAQQNDLTPVQSMLHAHTLSVAVLPEIYGSL